MKQSVSPWKAYVPVLWTVFIIALIFTCIGIAVFRGENTTDLPDETPTGGEEISFELPRDPKLSMHPNARWAQSLGGSGTDVAAGVIALEHFYVFGTTTSTDHDLLGSGQRDIFLACVDKNGVMQKARTFGKDGDDDVFDAKPFSDILGGGGSGILLTSSNAQTPSAISLYTISPDLETVNSADFHFRGTVTSLKLQVTTNGFALFLTGTDGLNRACASVLFVTFDLRLAWEKELPNISPCSIVDALDFQTSFLLLVNFSGAQSNSFGLLSLQYDSEKPANAFSVSTFSGNDNRSALQLLPSKDGFYILFSSVENSVKRLKVLALTPALETRFLHVVSGENHDSGLLVSDLRTDVNGGFYVLATKSDSHSYQTTLSYVSLHGDLTYENSTLFAGSKPVSVFYGNSALAIASVTHASGGADVLLVELLADRSTRAFRFGGSGADTPVRIFESERGLLLLANTTSEDGETPYSFGKSDVLLLSLSLD